MKRGNRKRVKRSGRGEKKKWISKMIKKRKKMKRKNRNRTIKTDKK